MLLDQTHCCTSEVLQKLLYRNGQSYFSPLIPRLGVSANTEHRVLWGIDRDNSQFILCWIAGIYLYCYCFWVVPAPLALGLTEHFNVPVWISQKHVRKKGGAPEEKRKKKKNDVICWSILAWSRRQRMCDSGKISLLPITTKQLYLYLPLPAPRK